MNEKNGFYVYFNYNYAINGYMSTIADETLKEITYKAISIVTKATPRTNYKRKTIALHNFIYDIVLYYKIDTKIVYVYHLIIAKITFLYFIVNHTELFYV